MADHVPLDAVVSHWSTLIENFQASPLAFYEALEAALKRRDIPATKNERVDYREAGVLSANREYLHVRREKLVFDVCAAPFGTGFFISWWLAEDHAGLHPVARALMLLGMLIAASWLLFTAGFVLGTIFMVMIAIGGTIGLEQMVRAGTMDEGVVRSVPLLGTLYLWMFKPASYYRIDTMEMFQKAVHNAVLEVIDTMTTEKGIRALSENDRKPIMREFYSKKSS